MSAISADLSHLGAHLESGADVLGFPLSEEQAARLVAYLVLLERWNRVYNLTAVREPERMVGLHILDSMTALPYIRGTSVLDVGSGGGLPGLVLAILRPDLDVTVVDAVAKKMRFCQQVISELGLENASAVHSRVEQLNPCSLFATIISRAFSSISQFVSLTRTHLAKDGRLVAMKGQHPEHEILEAKLGDARVDCYPVAVPGVDAERHIVTIGFAVSPNE